MSKILVAYFSAEGNTAGVAARLAEAVGADLFEIKPEQPYTKEDINWKNPLSRCNREKFGKKDVPVAGTVEGFEDYGLVFLGFPIWYYAAPNIVNTFVKAYDWTGKRIALFATSGGSGIEKSPEKLKPFLNGKGDIVGAKRFAVSADAAEFKEWADEFIMPWKAHSAQHDPQKADITVKTTEYMDRFNRMRDMGERDFPENQK